MAGLCEGGNEPPGFLKANEVYRTKPRKLEELEARIQGVITNIPSNFLQKTVDSIPGRLRKLVDATENTVTGMSYLDMLTEWLFPQLEEEGNEFLFQQDGAPPHWHLDVRNVLNQQLAGRWIGRAGNQDVLCNWPLRSPDLIVCDFFLWGQIKNLVYIPPLLQNLQELQLRITAAIESIPTLVHVGTCVA
ncbi:hypothetical protein ANN_19618 [Periplaneta americana]|uniref:Uncharacterized protein n=1 Tax=Periplaneta americana TaxID=6978 RepID=A0ABQ8SBA3_PERAM|nr:hypothetical protein ANN_19618 [Periplaneta americana]